MQNNIFILGGKPYKLDLTEIVYNFDTVYRLNCNILYMGDASNDIYYLNHHVYENFFKQKKSFEQLKKIYEFIESKLIENFLDIINNNKYKDIMCQFEQCSNNKSNSILEKIKCPIKFNKQPRCGYQCILYNILIGIKPTVCNFSFKDEEGFTNNVQKKISLCHDTKSEIKVLHWLHNNNYIDATLCMLEDHELPVLDCQNLNINPDIVYLLIKQFGICILRNYYDKDTIEGINKEFERVFLEHKDKKLILDTENCSCDERIHNTEKYSEYIKNKFSDNNLFNFIAGTYQKYKNGILGSHKKTLINLLEYEEGKIKNSGAGWHRDNNDCQFKAIMYLSDVTSKNGPFTWITKSSKKYIGVPKTRPGRSSRFFDDTIEDLLNNNKTCKKIEICGNKGDIILADTTYVHRGKIIEEGSRKAITQYFF